MRKNRLHTSTLIVGIIVALAISFSQYYAPDSTSSGKVKTEQAGNESNEETRSYISLPTFSLPVPVHVQANLDAYCLFEIFFEEDTDVDHVEDDLFYTDRFLQTIFGVIIAPNAP